MKKTNKYIYWAFAINFICAFVSIIGFVFLGEGLFTLSNDFNAQELSFNMFANEAIRRGDIFWNWNIDIGSDFITTFSFYNLGSPFFWLSLLFKPSAFPYVMSGIYMLKYAVAGVTSFLYLRLFAKDERTSLCCSVLYAFSGFQCANLVFYHFHDVVAFFPLLLYGLEVMMRKGKKGIFALAVLLNALVNYVFFIGEVIFVVIYFVIRFLIEDWKNIKAIPQCIVEGGLGVGMAGVLFVPSCVSVLNNSRVSSHLEGMDMFLFSLKDYLWNIKALFLPGDNMARQSVIGDCNWYSVSAYLPLLGVVLVLAFLIKKRSSWLSRMIIILLVMAFVPILNSTFVMFNVEPYRRWYYMLVLMMVLASQYVLEQRTEYPIQLATLICVGIIIIFSAFILIYEHSTEEIIIFRPLIYLLYVMIAITGIFVTFHIVNKKKNFYFNLLCSIMAMAIVTTGLNIFTYRQNDEHSSSRDTYNDVVMTGEDLEKEILPYRYEFWENYYNRGLASYLPTRNSFSTTVSTSIFELYDMLGAHRHTIGVNGPEGTSELLGVGYYVSNIEIDGKPYLKKLNNGSHDIWIYDKRQLPIGFSHNTYMTQEEFLKLDPEVRACAMLHSLVVKDEDEKKVQHILRKYDSSFDGKIMIENKEKYIEERQKEVIESFKKNKHGFQSSIQAQNETYVFFSVPYDKQWKATVNGTEKEVLNINGLMAIEVEQGFSTIEFTYSSMYLKIGCIISIISIVGMVVWVKTSKRRRTEK